MNIEAIKRRLLVKYPPFGSILANTNFVADSSFKTAGTDGENIYYNPRFIESLTDDEQLFIFAHELCHIAFNHIFRSEGKDKNIWNKATDSVVNAILKEDGLPLVKGGVDMPEAINYDAEEVYKKMLDEKKQNQNEKGNDQAQNDNQHQGDDNGQSKNEQEQSQGQSNSYEDDSQNQKQDQEQQQGSNSEQNENEQEQSQRQSDSSEDDLQNQKQDQEKQQSSDSGQNENEQEQSQGQSDSSKDDFQNQKQGQEKQQSSDSRQNVNEHGQSHGQGNSSDESSQNQNKQSQNQGDSESDGESHEEKETDIGHDAHSMWDKAIKKKHQQEQQSHGQSDSSEDDSQNQKQDQEKQQNSDSGQDENEQEQSQEQGNSSEESSQNQNKQSQNQDNGKSNENPKEDKETDVGRGAHSMWDKAIEKKHQQEQQSQGQSDSSEDDSQNQKQDQEKQQSSDSRQNEDEQGQSQGQGNSSDESSQNQNKQSQNQGDSKSDGESHEEKETDIEHDTHSMWDKAIEKKHQQEQQSHSNKQSNDRGEHKDKESLSSEKKEEIEKLTKLGEKEAFKQIKIERQKQLDELRKSLASQSHGYGSTTSSEKRNVTDIGISKPIIDWRRLLNEAVKYDVDWSYQNAGIENGVVTPYLEEMPNPETEIVLDTSGSVDETLLRNFLRECKNILQTSRVKVGCFDTQFYGFTEIKSIYDIDNLTFLGGGGTDFDVAVDAFTNRVENKIIFTDGYAPMPYKPIDAIWVVFGEMEIDPVGGKVIHIDNEQLERLYNYQTGDMTKKLSR